MKEYQDVAARRLASGGLEKIEEVQKIVHRARQLRAENQVDALPSVPGAAAKPFDWEASQPGEEVQRKLFIAAVEEEATGLGLTAYFYAAPCKDEDAVRRKMASLVGRHLADAARVSRFTESPTSADFFMSPMMVRELTEFTCGSEAPGVVSFFAEFHINPG
tara:strand:+ start:679 stop:1164 length:486 start_codon:yes stop_codon:yes gene_type:complete